MAFRSAGRMTQHHYITLPDPLDQITSSPTKREISKFLGQISYQEFPEFILDILEKVLNHKKVDITDGQGDEQQDILTINPAGQRCLTQCKHTETPGSHYNGKELDTLVTVCLRKDCVQALFVTNGDLTPQAKKYVTDKEYNRMFKSLDKDISVDIDYWNDLKIWDLVKQNHDILNKWFSGLGQTSGMRNFKFEVTAQVMPYDTSIASISPSEELVQMLLKEGKIRPGVRTEEFVGELPTGIKLHLHKWFQLSANLDINYVLPEDSIDFLNKPMFALVIEAFVPDTIGKYNPELIRDDIVKYLFNEVLVLQDEKHWWHITASPNKSFIFLYDVGQPQEVKLSSAKTYVKVNNESVIGEYSHCCLGRGFEPTSEDPDDNGMWSHSSGYHVYQMFDQKLDPASMYNHQVSQMRDLKEIEQFHFFAAIEIDNRLSFRVRAILPFQWYAMMDENDTVYWGIPKDEEEEKIDYIHQKLKVLGIQVLTVREDDKKGILKRVSNDLPPATSMFVSDLNNVNFPISLDRRIFGITADIFVPDKMTIEIAVKLLEYKYRLEVIHGFENLLGAKELKSHTSELPDLLGNIMSFRGSIMLDIGIRNNPIKVFLRIARNELLSSDTLMSNYIKEATDIFSDVEHIVNGRDAVKY